jgi:exopolysaccharide biosynthesis polyprenyl glycosylphosphotransferase
MASGLLFVLLGVALYEVAYRFSRPRLYLIVGGRQRAVEAYKILKSHGEKRGNVLGFVDSDSSFARYLPCDYLGGLETLEKILMSNPVEMVYIALPIKSQYAAVQETIWTCERLGVECSCPAEVFETGLGRQSHSSLRDLKISVYRMVEEGDQMLLKRGMDVVVASFALLLLSPIMLAVAVAVKLTSPGPALFIQERYGKYRGRFRMYKFRSMVAGAEGLQKELEEQNEASGPIFKIKRDPRITTVGRVLRKLSLDELPQLVNVLKGEMSLVGPRPMALRDVHLFSEGYLMRRFSVSPGITGLWQVSGRSNTDFATWIDLDLQYIDGWSIGLDLKILLQTVPVVLSGTGAA